MLLTFVFALACVHCANSAKLLSYTTESFNQVNDFMDVHHWSHNNDTIAALGKVIRKYNMQEHVFLQLLHTHFKLYPNEILIETMLENDTWTYPYHISSSYSDNVSPYLLGFTEIGDVVPLEFVAPSEYLSKKEMDNRVQIIVGATDFVDAFTTKLAELGATGIFGIGVPHREYLSSRFAGNTMENSNARRRFYHVFGQVKNNTANEPKSTPVENLKCGVHACTAHCGVHCVDHNEGYVSPPENLKCGIHVCSSHCGVHCQNHNQGYVPENLKCGVHACTAHCGVHCVNHNQGSGFTMDGQDCFHPSCTGHCTDHGQNNPVQECSHCSHCSEHEQGNSTQECFHCHHCMGHCAGHSSCSHCNCLRNGIQFPMNKDEDEPADDGITVQVGWSFR